MESHIKHSTLVMLVHRTKEVNDATEMLRRARATVEEKTAALKEFCAAENIRIDGDDVVVQVHLKETPATKMHCDVCFRTMELASAFIGTVHYPCAATDNHESAGVWRSGKPTPASRPS